MAVEMDIKMQVMCTCASDSYLKGQVFEIMDMQGMKAWKTADTRSLQTVRAWGRRLEQYVRTDRRIRERWRGWWKH